MITRRKLLAATPVIAVLPFIGENAKAKKSSSVEDPQEIPFASDYNFYYDELGHYFQFEYLVQHNREWIDVLYKCYPLLAHHREGIGLDYDHAAIYEVHHYPKDVVYDMGSENFEDHLRHNLRQFQSDVYALIYDWFGLKKKSEVVKLSDQPHDWLHNQVGVFFATP